MKSRSIDARSRAAAAMAAFLRLVYVAHDGGESAGAMGIDDDRARAGSGGLRV
jgi:hypothetical protein